MSNITVSSQIIEVLNYLGEKFGIVIDWSSQNVMPYIEQLLGKFISWEIATSWLWIVIGCIFLIAGICFITLEIASEWNLEGLIFALGFILSIIGLTIIGAQVYDIITATVFPEKTIFDYIKYQINILD